MHSSSAKSHTRLIALSVLITGAGCSADTSSGPEANVVVTTSVSRATVAPGESVNITVRATPVGTSMVRWITLATSGLVSTRDSVAFTTSGPQEVSRTVTLPLQPVAGTLTITGSASAGAATVSDAKSVAVLDELPPVILRFDGPFGPAAPGDYVTFAFRVRDSVGVKRVRLSVDNAFRAADSVEFAVGRREAIGTVQVRVPNDAAVGFTAIAWLTAFDESQHFATAQVTVPIRDFRLPVATLTLGALRADHTIGTGDTLQITASATENHSLTHIGYEGAGIRDSVAATGLAASHTYRVPVPAAWRQQRPVFRAWARDVSGNLSTITLDTEKELPVYDWVDRPFISIAFSNNPFPIDVAWDAKRSVAYVLRADGDGDGTGSRIEVIRLPSGTLGAPIPVGRLAQGFSLTASGDSLVVTLTHERALGVVDLTAASPAAVRVPLPFAVEANQLPGVARTAGTHVFVPLVGGSDAARLLDVNLATGVQALRTDVGDSGRLTYAPILFQLPDGRLLLNREAESYGSNESFVYAAASNAFALTVPLRPTRPGQFSASPSGLFMLRSIVYDATMNEVSTVTTQDWSENHLNPAALSADGESVYLATWYGYQKARVADGFVLEQGKLEMAPQFVVALPDGKTLLAIGPRPGSITGESALMIVDLR